MFRPLRALIKPLVRPIVERLREESDARLSSFMRFAPISKFSEDDVFVVGYPKSGNTWFQHLVAGVIYGIDPEYAPDTLVQEVVPDVHAKRYYKRFGTPMFFKSHFLPRPEYRRVVYLLRDGRDVMVSFFHYNRGLTGERTDFLTMVRTGVGLFPCKWHEHVDAWLLNPYGAQMLLIKYEDLKMTPVDQLRRFCAFVGLERDRSTLETIVAKATFEKMRQKEIRFGQDDARWPRDMPFMRRGEIGSHKDEMGADVLEAFEGEARETLARCGYL